MRIAILDLGTNTFHLLIADVKGKSYRKVFKSKTVVKLGEGAIHRKFIAPDPFHRGIEALTHYKGIIHEFSPDKVYAFATSAIRGASNGKQFVKEAFKRTGIRIKIISGDKEAELICLGVRQCVDMGREPSLIMDIGGGSTEFIIANGRKIFWKKSFDIGAARLLEIFNPSDPVSEKDIKEIHLFLDMQLKPLKSAIKKFPANKLIGSSGSFDTFAEMAGYRYHGKNVIKKMKSYKFDLDEFKKLHKVILKSTLKQRMRMKGLVKMRVDMIVIATICTDYILQNLNMSEMYLSKYALKEGALWKAMNSATNKKVK